MSLSRLVFRAGYGIRLYRILIIAFLSTLVSNSTRRLIYMRKYCSYQHSVTLINLCPEMQGKFWQRINLSGKFRVHNVYYVTGVSCPKSILLIRRNGSCSSVIPGLHINDFVNVRSFPQCPIDSVTSVYLLPSYTSHRL